MFLRAFIVLDLGLCSVFCQGQPQLIGSSQPIVATVGDDVILPCLYNPARDVSGLTLEWTRPDLDPRFVFVWRSSDELTELKHPQYTGRTVVFTDELKHGNISLKLRKVQPSDEGTYRCFIPTMGVETSVRLNVSALSWAQVSVAAVDGWRAAVVLQCESRGWYPEPELLWLDSEGRPLSADPTQTHRRSDGLYNVSSRVTVEQSHGSTFTCRVSESSTNQSTHTSLQVSGDFFTVNLRLIIISLTVMAAVCSGIIIVGILAFIRWKMKYSKYQPPEDLEAKAGEESHNLLLLQTQTETQTETQSSAQAPALTQSPPQSPAQSSAQSSAQSPAQAPAQAPAQFSVLAQAQSDTETETERLQKENESLKTKLEFIIQELKLVQEKKKRTFLIDSVDPKGTNITLRNKSNKQTTSLQDWTVTIVVDFSEPYVYKFSGFKFKPESTVTIWAKGCRPKDPLDTDLEWTDQSPWNTGRIVFVSLYNKHQQLIDKRIEGMKSDSE